MKDEVRTVGFDDGPFDFDDGAVPVVGVVMRGSSYVEAVLHDEVAVDGADATDTLAGALSDSRYLDGLKAVLVDGVALGGFNVVDLTRLSEAVDTPVVSVARGSPDRGDIREALRAHFDDWEERMAVIDEHWPTTLSLGEGEVSVHAVGLDDEEVPELLAASTARGLLPEPLRLAHLISTALVEGESSGQA